MSDQKYFSGASEYFILEGEARFMLEHLGTADLLAHERIHFKENLLNDLVVRIADADLKINLLSQAMEKYEAGKREILSAEVSIEFSLLDDSLQTNLLEVAELLAQFLIRLRQKIPAHAHLFRKQKKALYATEETIQQAYNQSRAFLFPDLQESNNKGKVTVIHFYRLADRLELVANPILDFRDKVIAHKYDEDRFSTRLSFEQYSEIKKYFKTILDAVAIVGTLSFNDWCMTRTNIEIERVTTWLNEGLIASVPRIRTNVSAESLKS